MTTLREAAQQALEALDYCIEHSAEIVAERAKDRGQGSDDLQMMMVEYLEKHRCVITTLRAALAEQDDDLTAAWMAGAAEERKRAEQAQPVAWRYKPMVGSPWSLSDDGYYVSCKRDNGYIVQSLYTTPPAPQSLTIERLRDALVASRVIDLGAVEDPDNYDDGVTRARIEALHRRIT